MTLFFRYIRERRWVLAAFGLFCGIFATVFALYHIPPAAVLYPSLLCLLCGLLLTAADFYKVRRRHKELERMSKLPSALIGELPDTGTIGDEDYGKVIRSLQKELAALESTANARYHDMIDYYTIWAHQIKTPIAAMRLSLQNMDTGESRRLQSELSRIEQYVEMVLAFLRLDSDSSDYVFREYELDPIIRQAVKKISHEFIDRKISLQYEPVSAKIITDEKWLSFVLEQLISNALKYTRGGSVRIYMTGEKTLCIQDTGIGIAPEDLPRIFEKGYTGYNGRTDKKASGIGLYLCRRICDNLGIGISVSSRLGEGTIVTLQMEQYQLKKE